MNSTDSTKCLCDIVKYFKESLMSDAKQNQNSFTTDIVSLLKVSFSSLQMSFILLNVETDD